MAAQQNVKLGFALAMVTAVMWGSIPIAIKYALTGVDSYTLVWYRFFISAVCITLLLAVKKQFPVLSLFKQHRWLILLVIAVLGLAGNFSMFAMGVNYLSPTASQVVAQLAVVLFMVSSAFVFRERLRATQIIGIMVLIIGLLLFFNTSLVELFTNLSEYAKGVWLCVFASISWTCYALAQKVLIRQLKAEQLLWLLYIACSIILLPMAKPLELFLCDGLQIAAVVYCGFNTIVGYGALVAAMERWQAAQVSAITTLTPLFALLFSDILALIWPDMFNMMSLNILGYIGAIAVVAGAMFATIGHYIWHPRKGILINQNSGDKK